MLSRQLFKIYQRFVNNRRRNRNLAFIFLFLVIFAIFRQVAFIFRRNYYRSFYLDDWFIPTYACEGNFIGYGHQFVWLRDAQVDAQTQSFKIACSSELPRYWFYKGYQGTPYEQWLADMRTVDRIHSLTFRSGITVVLKRNEAHNPYHTFCEFYNIFLMAKHFNWVPKAVDILFMDSRPKSPLDEMWDTLFKDVRKVTDLSPTETFKNLVWMPIGYESPLNSHLLRTIPYTEEFRSFVLKSFQVNQAKLNCKKLNIVLILRHDYISHPERLEMFQGKIHRKMANEPEVIWALEKAFHGHNVRTVVLEEMSMKDQLELVSSTDVLIGMHGAGLAHIMFLPSHACVLELFPYSYKWRMAYYFMAMSKWRNLKHIVWTNPSQADEIERGFSSRIPPEYISKLSLDIKQYIRKNHCPDISM